MKRARALQWPESVLVSNPYNGTMLKHKKTFCIIFFVLHQYRATFWVVKSISLAYFGPFWLKFWAVSKKVAGRSIYTVAGDTSNSPNIFFNIKIVSHNNIGHGGPPQLFRTKLHKIFLL